MPTDGVGVQIGRKLAKTLCWLRSVVSELFYFDCEKASQIFNQFISNVVMITFLSVQIYCFLCVYSQYQIITEMQSRHIELIYP